jgi:repressor LexA
VAESGDIVVVMLNDEAPVKRLFIRDEKIVLRPEIRSIDRSPSDPTTGCA